MSYPIATAYHGSCHSYNKTIGLFLPDSSFISTQGIKLQEAGWGSIGLDGVVFPILMARFLNQRAANLGFCSPVVRTPISKGALRMYLLRHLLQA